LAAVDLAVVQEWRTTRLATVAASTCNREVDLLKAMLQAAVPKYLAASPIAGLKRLRAERRAIYVLDREAERQLLAVLPAPDRAIVLCALDTLMRLSDVLSLRRDQDRGGYLIVEDPKVHPYKVPVSSRLRLALDALPNAGPYFFAHRRTAENPRDHRGAMQAVLERACQRAGVTYGRRRRGLTFHGLRHTGATRLAEAGVSLRVIQELGGWRSLRQIERYAHPTEAAKRHAVECIGSDHQEAQ
jgi:integrase